jgi:hypothetical protein
MMRLWMMMMMMIVPGLSISITISPIDTRMLAPLSAGTTSYTVAAIPPRTRLIRWIGMR